MKQSPYEMFLDRLDPSWRGDQLAFFRIAAEAGPEAVEDLASRVHRVSCSAGLRRLALEFSYYFPWPEWAPVVDRVLKHEKDLALFETGARALGRIGTPEALEALRSLSLSRATPGFREIVAQALHESDPAEAFQHHFSRLLQGSAQPGEANESAHQLAKMLGPDSLAPLKAGVSHPDPLVFRHALRLIGLIPSKEAATFLHDYFKDTHLDALEDRETRTLLSSFRTLPRPEVREKVIQILEGRWQEKLPEAAADLGSADVERSKAAVGVLRATGTGVLDTLLLDTLIASTEDKPAHLAKHLTQAGETAQQRSRRIDFALDSAAQSLSKMVGKGLLEQASLLSTLAEALRRATANAGVASALARLVPVARQELVDLLIDHSEGALRAAAVEVLGERKDPGFRAAFLKLRRDAIAEISERSLWHLGQLPDPAGTARALLGDRDPEEARVGLRFITMHRLEPLVPDLLELTSREIPEDLLIAALATLGGLGSAQAVEPLLALLHSGQNPPVQAAIGGALRDLGDPAGALALCAKAKELNSATLHTLAVEALARAHGIPERPLPASASEALLQATRAAWADRRPWAFRRRIADALLVLHAQDAGVWAPLVDLFQATLSEKRNPGSVPSEDLGHLNTSARRLAQKGKG